MIRLPHCLIPATLAASTCLTSHGVAAPMTVTLQNAAATYSQNSPTYGSFLVGQAIDGYLTGGNGWAILDDPGNPNAHAEAQTAAFETASDTGYVQGTRLTVNLHQLLFDGTYTGSLHELGRFRISVTTDDRTTFGALESGEAGYDPAATYHTGGDVTANWTVLHAQTALDTGVEDPSTPIFLDPLGDGSIRAINASGGGSEGNRDATVYTLTFHTNLTNITGLRLEAMQDSGLPYGGPGTTPNGNFVLTELTLDAEALLPQIGAADTLAFGDVRVGTTATNDLTLTNTGEVESVLLGSITGLTPTSDPTTPGFSATVGANDPFAIVTGQSEGRTFRFTPLTRGAASDEMTIATDHAGDANVTLIANGVGPEFTSDAPANDPIDLGKTAVQGTTGTDLALSNTTSDLGLPDTLTGLTLLSYQITGDDAGLFSLTNFAPGTVLSAGELTALHLLMTADDTLGVKTATLTLVTDQGAALGDTGETFSFDLTAEVVTEVPTPSSSLCLAALLIARRRRRR